MLTEISHQRRSMNEDRRPLRGKMRRRRSVGTT